jgi:hypothetical protein
MILLFAIIIVLVQLYYCLRYSSGFRTFCATLLTWGTMWVLLVYLKGMS